jgi:hypothetical protein
MNFTAKKKNQQKKEKKKKTHKLSKFPYFEPPWLSPVTILTSVG